MPVVVITGMRQTGKSTFLQMEPEPGKRNYITFDDFAQLEAAKNDPENFINFDGPITIDEVQKCPEILTTIKRKVDKKRIPGQFLLSGSTNLAMLKGVSESLAGRAIYFTMYPLTKREINRQISEESFIYNFFKTQKIRTIKNIKPLDEEDILRGGMPTVALKIVNDKSLWFKGFEQTYLERDLRDLSQIGNIIQFRHLLHLAAIRTGNLLSVSQLGRDAKLNSATTSRYLSLLEASFVISHIKPYLRNPASRLIKSPKIYITDSGLACYLSEIKNFESDLLKEAMFETYFAQNLSGIIDTCLSSASLNFWNIQGRYEVDFVIENEGKSIAIETKSFSRFGLNDLSGLKAFLHTTPNCIAGILVYNGDQIVKLGDRLWAIPLSVVLS